MSYIQQTWVVLLTFKPVFGVLGRDTVKNLEDKNKANIDRTL